MNEAAKQNHLPLTRSQVLRACLDEGKLDTGDRALLAQASQRIDAHFQREFHDLKEQMKAAYSLRDPDVDIATGVVLPTGDEPAELDRMLAALLERANYSRISRQALADAFELSSLFDLQLSVDLDQFDEVLLYYRGVTPCEEERRSWFGLVHRILRFDSYDRLVLFLRFAQTTPNDADVEQYPPGSIMLKLFRNVPENDLEMLFPNTRVGMRLRDKLTIGIPAVISGVTVITTRVGAALALLGSLAGFWLGLRDEPVALDRTTALVLLAGFGALGAFLWKQFSKYRNRKLKFSQALTEHLYFKLQDNNAGVLLRLLDEAESAECNECLLACYFLLAEGKTTNPAVLAGKVEAWFARRWQRPLSFDAEDALGKLQAIGIAGQEGGQWRVLPLGSGKAGT